MKPVATAVVLALLSATPALAEDPETIVKRLRDDAGECHYVLSICSDTVRAEESLATLRNDPAASPDQVTAGEARVAKQVDLLNRAAAAVRKRHTDVPECFRHCARLRDSR